METKHQNIGTFQKWVYVYDIMLDKFKKQGYWVTIDSAYVLGHIMELIGCHEWKVNMVGSLQENIIGAEIAEEKKGTKKNAYKIVM